MEANDTTIKILDALIFAFCDASSTIGIKMATTGVLLMNAETKPTKIMITKIPRVLLCKRSSAR